MIRSFLVCDSQGYPFYSRLVDKKFRDVDPAMLSGLISAIGSVGRQLFNEEIATITYGIGVRTSSIVIVAKEILSLDKSIYFVFLVQGECDQKFMKRLATSIFIETKNTLKSPHLVKGDVQDKIDRLVDFKFDGLMNH